MITENSELMNKLNTSKLESDNIISDLKNKNIQLNSKLHMLTDRANESNQIDNNISYLYETKNNEHNNDINQYREIINFQKNEIQYMTLINQNLTNELQN